MCLVPYLIIVHYNRHLFVSFSSLYVCFDEHFGLFVGIDKLFLLTMKKKKMMMMTMMKMKKNMMFVVVVVVIDIDVVVVVVVVVVVEEFLEDNIEGEKNKIVVVVVVDWNCYVKRMTSDCSSPEVHPQFCPRCCRCRP